MFKIILFLTAVFLIFSFVHYVSKKKKPFKRAFLSILSGVGTLIIVNLISPLTAVGIPVTWLSLMISAAGGIPGVALMVVLSMF